MKYIKKIRGIHVNKKGMAALCAVAVCIGLFTGTTASAAGETGEFRSRGSIRYQDAGGQEVILDAKDFDTLFQFYPDQRHTYPYSNDKYLPSWQSVVLSGLFP